MDKVYSTNKRGNRTGFLSNKRIANNNIHSYEALKTDTLMKSNRGG